MAVKGTSDGNLKRNPRDIMNLLSSMASEWFLMFLMFVDAALSYLTVKFARYCKLQTPCPLCSRLDHVFRREKSAFYGGLLCSNHRREISSLICCHIHGKLANARGMCEKCLMSFIMQNKSNSESYSLLAGKLGALCNKDTIPGSLTTKTCSCCNKVWRARSNAQRLLQLAPVEFGTVKSSGKPPLPRIPGRGHLSRRNTFKKIRNKISGSTTPCCVENTGVNPLPNVGYRKLKITSDSDSDFPFSDDEDGNYTNHGSTVPKKVLVIQNSSGILPKVLSDNLAPVKQTHQVSDVGPSRLDQCVQLDVSKPRDVEYLASEDVIGHGLGEQNRKQANPKPNLSTLPELVDVPSPSNAVEVPGVLSENKRNVPPRLYSSASVLSESVSINDIPPSSIVIENLFGASSEKSINAVGVSDIGHKSVTKHVEISELMTTTTADQALKDIVPLSIDVDPSYESELADSNTGREISGMFAELAVSGDAAEIHDQILPADGVSQSLNDTSPRVHGHLDELQRSDASSSNRIRVLQKSAAVRRNDSGYESLGGCSVSGIKVESIVDWLKRQVEYYRGCLTALQKEFDEERNASEVAARHAMAMITKLQEEKASVHMEALHYLRMMDEQAEYDMETLEKANDLLAEKDKEIQDLEAELEYYRINFPNEVIVESLPGETSNLKVEKMRIENDTVPHIQSNANTPYDSMSTIMSESTGKRNNSSTPLLDFKDERLYISQCLKKLETNLQLAYGNWVPADMPSDGYSDKIKGGVNNPTVSLNSGDTQTDHQKEENGLVMPTDLSALNGSFSTEEGSDFSIKDNSSVVKGNKSLEFDRQESSIHGLENDFISLEKEISDLNGRLVALEADHDFLEHAFSSLRYGNEGLQFIQQIAHQLQELRNIGTEKGCLTIP